MTWDQFLARAKSGSEDFVAQVALARRALAGKAREVCAETTQAVQEVELAMTKEYDFLPAAAWDGIFDLPPHEVGMDPVTVLNEYGDATTGFIFTAGPWRKLQVTARSTGKLQTTILGADKILRPSQGRDYYNWTREVVCEDQRPRTLKARYAGPMLTRQQVQERVATQLAARAADAARVPQEPEANPEAVAEAAPVPAAAPEAAEENAEDETDSDQDTPMLPPTLLGPMLPGEGKGRSKGKNKNKTQQQGRARAGSSVSGRGGGRPRASQLQREPPRDGTAAPSERSRSPTRVADDVSRDGGSTVSPSAGDQILTNAKKYVSTLEEILPKIVIGQNCGQDINNGRRSMEALKKRDPTAAEVVELQGKLNLIAIAKKVRTSNMAALPQKDRQDALKEVFPRMAELPEQWCMAIFLLAMKDMMAKLSVAEVRSHWLPMVAITAPTRGALQVRRVPVPSHHIQKSHVVF